MLTKTQLAIIWAVGGVLALLLAYNNLEIDSDYAGGKYLRVESALYGIYLPILILGTCAFLTTLRKRN